MVSKVIPSCLKLCHVLQHFLMTLVVTLFGSLLATRHITPEGYDPVCPV